jgi:hypothetical protein
MKDKPANSVTGCDASGKFPTSNIYYLTALLVLFTVPASNRDRTTVNSLTSSTQLNALSAMAAARAAAARRRARANKPDSGDDRD